MIMLDLLCFCKMSIPTRESFPNLKISPQCTVWSCNSFLMITPGNAAYVFHEHLLPSPASLELLQALAKQFTWFGNTSLAEIFHHALYDPTYLDCFCFTEDIKIDGHCIWAPLESALPQQAGQVLSWISYTVLKCSHQIGLTNQYRLRNLLDSISHRQTKCGDNLTSTQTSQTLLLHMILSSKK